MLFISKSVSEARAELWRNLDTGKVTVEEAFQKALELDSDDHIALTKLGRLRREAGDFAAAEEYLWRAIRAHPCEAAPYLELALTLRDQPESKAMAMALEELGIAKRALYDETFMEGVDLKEAGLPAKVIEKLGEFSSDVHGKFLLTAMRARRGAEPAEVTRRLRPLRLIQDMLEEVVLSREKVDEIIAEGDAMAPLLLGVVRDWAQDVIEGDEGDDAMESAFALLGETGAPSEIAYLLDCVVLADETAAGASSWALGRIVERHSQESHRKVASLAATLDGAKRIAVAEQILRRPQLDPTGTLLTRLSEDIEGMTRAERDQFFPALIMSMAVSKREKGVRLARAALLRQGSLLSRDVRRECESLLAEFELAGVSPAPLPPLPWTVYQICAGEADWDEDDDIEEDESEYVPEPVRRMATPGRNDPCWCHSGKKYKKCHLESDERQRQTPGERAAVAGREDEFVGLRRRLGAFLGDVLPERDLKRAIKEFFADEQADGKDAQISITDWTIHDWIAPSLGRTVMQEFLARHGSGISERAREMVEAWSRSYIGLYEVQELKPGTGLTLKDLLSGEIFFVHDVSMSKQLTRWDGLLTRVVPGERGGELAGIGLTVPRHSIDTLRLWMDADREEAGLAWPDYLKRNWPRIRRHSYQMAADWAGALRLTNTDGEELLFSKVVYRLSDQTAVLKALRNCPELDTGSGGEDTREHFVWLDKKKTVLGNIRVGKDELDLESNSKERMERGKLLLAGLAGKWLEHRRDEFTTQKELKRRAAAAPRDSRPDAEEIPKHVRDEVIARFMQDHYRQWPDSKLPALEGKTPREAVRTPKGRQQVIEILKTIENGEERKRRSGEVYYDVSSLRADLGVE